MNQTDTDNKSVSTLEAPGSNEFKLTVIAFLYFFFVICSYYVLKPVRDGLALEIGATNINILNLLSMFSLIFVNAIYSVIVGKYKRDIFIPYITRFFVICLVIFWLIFTYAFPMKENSKENPIKSQTAVTEVASSSVNLSETTELQKPAPEKVTPSPKETNAEPEGKNWFKITCIGCYYLWVNIFSLIAVCMFWSFMNDVFTVSQGKRLYAYIGYGGLIGGTAGSELTKLLLKNFNFSTPSLFIVAIILLYPSIWCMKYIHNNHYHPEGIPEEDNKPVKPAHPANPMDGFKTVIKNFVLILMALEMFLYTCSTTLFSQQINSTIESELIVYEETNGGSSDSPVVNEEATKKIRTAFWADIYSKVNIASLIAQLVVTKLVMLLPNPIYGLLLLNIIQVIGNVLLLCLSKATLASQMAGMSVTLVIITWTFVLRRCLDYSTARVLRESVYIPMDRDAKYQGKGFIDTVIFRFGDGLSSVILFGGMNMIGYGHWIDYSILFTMVIQFYVIIKIARIYVNMVKKVGAPAPNTAEASVSDK